MTKQPLGPNQQKWIAALRSGRFLQGKARLCTVTPGEDRRHCCLGVAAELFCDDWNPACGGAPLDVIRSLCLRSDSARLQDETLDGCRFLTDANDRGHTFAEIADFCEQHPEAVFVEPR